MWVITKKGKIKLTIVNKYLVEKLHPLESGNNENDVQTVFSFCKIK